MPGEYSPATAIFAELRAAKILGTDAEPLRLQGLGQLPRLAIDPVLQEVRLTVQRLFIGTNGPASREETCIISDETIPFGIAAETIHCCSVLFQEHIEHLKAELEDKQMKLLRLLHDVDPREWFIPWFSHRRSKRRIERLRKELEYFHASARLFAALEDAFKPFRNENEDTFQEIQTALWAARNAEILVQRLLETRQRIHNICDGIEQLPEEH